MFQKTYCPLAPLGPSLGIHLVEHMAPDIRSQEIPPFKWLAANTSQMYFFFLTWLLLSTFFPSRVCFRDNLPHVESTCSCLWKFHETPVSRFVWVENIDIAHDNQGKTLLRLQKSGCSGVEANVAIVLCLSMYQCFLSAVFFPGFCMRCECAMSPELPAGNALNGERVITVMIINVSLQQLISSIVST